MDEAHYVVMINIRWKGRSRLQRSLMMQLMTACPTEQDLQTYVLDRLFSTKGFASLIEEVHTISADTYRARSCRGDLIHASLRYLFGPGELRKLIEERKAAVDHTG